MAFDDVPKLLKEFLFYLDIVNGKSEKTIYEYYLDLRLYLKFIKKHRLQLTEEIFEVSVTDIDVDFIKTIKLEDTYEYLFYMKERRGCSARTINRKSCSIRVFFKYLTNKAGILEKNPMENLESSSLSQTLPKYLSLDESISLLDSIDGNNAKRDYAMLELFLNCGLRLSELVSINLSDIDSDYITITGKGNKQRSIYLNSVCKSAIDDYIQNERPFDNLKHEAKKALFVSRNGNRISRRAVQNVVEKRLKESGLGDKKYSTHKLRHTAATLMHKYGGVDIRVLQEVLGHENLGTTQIYTHIDNEQVKNAIDSNPISRASKKDIRK